MFNSFSVAIGEAVCTIVQDSMATAHYILTLLLRKRGAPCVLGLLLLAMPAQSQFVNTATKHDARIDSSSELAPDAPLLDTPSRQYLLGDWGGKRSALEERGVKFDFFYIADLEANPYGGLQQTRAGWERIRGTADVNFDQFLPWRGLRFHATGLWQTGGNLGQKIGTLANPSDLVSLATTRLDSFWFEQNFAANKLRIRAGQLAGLDFYGNQEYGGSWVIEPLGYAFGNLFSSIYESFNPAGTPGTELRFAPNRHYYIKTAVMAGNRNPYKQDATGFHFQIRDTPNFLFETGYRTGGVPGSTANSTSQNKSYPGDYKFGAVYNGGKFPDATGRESNGNYLLYAMASQAVYRSDVGSSRGLDATYGFDWSPGDVSRENFQMTLGARVNAPFSGRQQDRAAFALVYSKISDPFQHSQTLLGAPPLGSEKAIEVNYAFQLTHFYLLQPVFQYYVNVGGNSALSNAPVFGFRTKVTF